MKTLALFIFSVLCSLLSFSQENETKMSAQLSNSTFSRVFTNTHDLYNLTKIDLGINFQRAKGDFYLFVTYGLNTNLLLSSQKSAGLTVFSYKSHMFGGSFEYHLLSIQRKVRPYFGMSILSELATNYKDGFMTPNSFYIINKPLNSMTNSYLFNISNFYQSTPFLGTLSLGCDFRLSKVVRLNFSMGYSLRKMKYKYLEWYDGDNYREMLKNVPVESKMFHFINAQLGLNYTFSIMKSKENTKI
ncbi:hypothetical protein CW751_00440 [Brumimicrobium salinarum]|uniref:Outer membrane protein beta-barrel domain-containing protein n=1 Tax=Brumimicrobium salinarum TaxID=2058658 RepID=A0A2I0R5I4_9FLAO|nr:hypothetical protein [Brumimicrobium salinarum]PKR81841.1 hypothetical protein CW751_00440 [Brumimicrobium salinarum]